MGKQENRSQQGLRSNTSAPAKGRIDPAVLISIIALIISLVGTIISVVETSILRRQQDMAADQMAASVWPYLDRSYNSNYRDDTVAYWTFKLENNGTGPAIIGNVEYIFDEQTFDFTGWIEALQPELNSLEIDLLTVTGFDDGIISPGESIEVIILRMKVDESTVDLISELPDRINVRFCYCSIYGACWESKDSERPRRNEACERKIEL
ncbi:MAG: hypothetical protein AAFY36_02645 [Bacteroidota bacterium]